MNPEALNQVKRMIQQLKVAHPNFNPQAYGIQMPKETSNVNVSGRDYTPSSTSYSSNIPLEHQKSDDEAFFESILGQSKKSNWFAN